MTFEKPEVWMISITGNSISQHYKDLVLPSWKDYKVNHFEAVTPKDMHKYSYLTFGKKRDRIDFTDTEKAVWYSHVECWVLARSKPIIIVEHDIMLMEEIEESIFETKMSCLAHSVSKTKQKLAGGAYYLTPDVAKHMVSHVKNIKKITYNSDAMIHRKCDEYGEWHQHKCFQIKDAKIGYTVEHNKK
jgi:hypothetical protein